MTGTPERRPRKPVDRDRKEKTEPLRKHVAALMSRFGLKQAAIAAALGLADKEIESLQAGRRSYQEHHISAMMEYFRSLASREISWSKSDEYKLLWVFVTGTESKEEKVDDDIFRKRAEFDLGGHRQDAIIFEFIQEGYQRNLIHSSFDRSPFKGFSITDDAAKFSKLLKEEAEVIKASPKLFNGSGLTLTYIESSRTDNDERPQLTMRFKRSDYVRRRATRRFFSELDEQRRGEILASVFDGVREEYCGGFGAVLSIITSDHKLLFFQRSANVAGDFHAFDCTVTEASDGNRDTDEFKQPSSLRTALRALAEEAALSSVEDDIQRAIQFHGVICRSRYYEWSLYGSLNLSIDTKAFMNAVLDKKKAKSDFAKAKMKFNTDELGTTFALAQDSFEFQRYAAVNFNLRDVARFICTQPMTDYAFVNAVLTLRSVLNVSTTAIAQELSLYPARR